MSGKRRRTVVGMLLVLMALLGLALAFAAQAKVQPSSHIIAIDTRSGVVSAKVNSTGEDFQFTLNNPALVGTLKIGQGVYANCGPSDEKIEASITRIDLSTRLVEAKDDASARLASLVGTADRVASLYRLLSSMQGS